MLASSFLNFLAALYASAVINLLTSGGVNLSGPVVFDAAVWVLASVFQAWAAHLSERAEREASLIIDRHLTREERRLVFKEESAKVSRQYWILTGLTGLWIIVAVLLVPGVL
jgi:uncharacterized membrane protein YraQ (UPF0718 family)